MVTKFHTAELVDNTYQVKFPFYEVDATTPETLRNSVEAIAKSKLTPEQKKGMLSVVKAHAFDMFSKEEQEALFEGLEETSEEPFAIELTSDNIQLVYEALNQLAASVASEESTDDSELETKLKESQEKLESLSTEKDELTSKVEELTQTLETVRGDLEAAEELIAANDLTERVAALETQIAEKDERIDGLTKRVAQLGAEAHESKAKEAAHLAQQLKKPIASNKSFEELVAVYSARTSESLSDTIADYMLEAEGSAEEGEEDPTVTLEDLKVTDPTLPTEEAAGTEASEGEGSSTSSGQALESVADELAKGITKEDEGIYLVCGLTAEEIAAIKAQS